MTGAGTDEPGGASRRWAEMLARWAIPDELMAAAPASPYFFDPQVFAQAADDALGRQGDTPSEQAAREALPAGGSLLDVGCGAGAASLRLGPGSVTGVDPSPSLLEEFAARAARLGVDATTIEGTWPDTASRSPLADVVVCHHVLYNVAELAPFAAALGEHARARVVVEITSVHPMTWMTPYWRALHGIGQPDRPTAGDAVAVLRELGLPVMQRRWLRRYQMIGETGHHSLEHIARRLCLPPARHDELRRLLEETPPPAAREVVTLWWAP